MKKVTITYYTSDDNNLLDEVTRKITESCTSCTELIKVNTVNIESDNDAKTDYIMLCASDYMKPTSGIVSLLEVTEDNRDTVYEKYNKVNDDSYRYRHFVLEEDEEGNYIVEPEFVAVSSSTNEIIPGCIILNVNNEKDRTRLGMQMGAYLANLRKISIKSYGNGFVGIIGGEIDGRVGLLSLIPKGNFDRTLEYILRGKLIDNERVSNDEELKEELITGLHTVVDSLIERGHEARLKNVIIDIISSCSLSCSLVSSSTEERAISKEVVRELISKSIESISKSIMVPAMFTSTKYNTTERNREAMPYIMMILKKYELIDDTEVKMAEKYVKQHNNEKNFVNQLLLSVSSIPLAIFIDSANSGPVGQGGANSSWSYPLAVSTAHLLKNNLIEIVKVYNFEAEWEKLSEDELAEIKAVMISVIRKYFICKEVDKLQSIMTEGIRMTCKAFVDFYMDVLLDVLEDYKGREHMTVRSIIKNGKMDLCVNKFDYSWVFFNNRITKNHKRIRKILFETSIE